jgi:hypothetical protein
MAPKRGGGGGGIHIGGDGSVDNRCSDSDSFKQPIVIAQITINALVAASFLIILLLWIIAKRRNPNIKLILPWYTFGILVGFTIM